MEPTSDTATSTSLDKDPATGTDAAAGPDGTGSAPAGGPAPRTAPVAAAPPRPPFRLQRSRTDRMLGGVCGGLAESLEIDATVLRIGIVALTVLGAWLLVVLYLAVWILAPQADPA